MDYLQTAVHGQ